MTLGFRTKWQIENMPIHMADKPTYFIEKIWASLINSIDDINISHYEEYLDAHKSIFNSDFGYNELYINPKKHTIRKDTNNKWKAGNNIHFVINNRTKNRFQFAPVVQCFSTQEIFITYNERICEKHSSEPAVFIDDKIVDYKTIEALAINDGFENEMDFFAWFRNDFKGKIIHWTSLKY